MIPKQGKEPPRKREGKLREEAFLVMYEIQLDSSMDEWVAALVLCPFKFILVAP